MEPIYLLEQISTVFGPSTCEDDTLAVIRQLLGDGYTLHHTAHKNLIVVPQRQTSPKHTIFFQAHVDELGFRANRYLENGLIQLIPLAYIPQTAMNHRLRFASTNVSGILHIEGEDKKTKYYLDVGAQNAVEAEALVPRYATGAYLSSWETSTNFLTGKSFDDRINCAAMVHLLNEVDAEGDTMIVGVFTTREETGNWPIPEIVRCCDKNQLSPDLIVNLEVCPGGPLPPGQENPPATLGKGVVLAHSDRGYICDGNVCRFMAELAVKYNIPHQQMSIRFAGGEMGRLALSFGALGYSLTVPVRNMHSPNSVVAKADYQALIAMLKAIASEWTPECTVSEKE